MIRTIHTRVIRENKAAFNSHLEPQQLALSEAGGHKLVHQVRMAMEQNRDWVVAKVDVRNAHNEQVNMRGGHLSFSIMFSAAPTA